MYEIYDLWSLSNKSLDIDLNEGYWHNCVRFGINER